MYVVMLCIFSIKFPLLGGGYIVLESIGNHIAYFVMQISYLLKA